MQDLLLISAAEFEAQPLIDSLRLHQIPLETFICGVGAINSARHAYQLSEKCKDRDCVFIGSAGIFGPFIKPTVYRINKAYWSCLSQRLGQAYVVKGDLRPVNISDRWPAWAKDLGHEAISVSAASISLSNYREYDLNLVLQEVPSPPNGTGRIFLENIELYSVADPIVKVARSFVAVLATTNEVGSHAHESWLAHHKVAAKTIAEELIGLLVRKV